MDNKDFDMNRYDYGETGGYEGPYAGDNYSNQSADNGLVGIDPTTSAANNTNAGYNYGGAYMQNQPNPELYVQPNPDQPDPVNVKADKKPSKKTFGRTMGKTIAAALVFGIVAGGTMTGINYAGGKLFGNDQKTETVAAGAQSDQVSTQSVSNTDNSTQTISYDVSEIVSKTQSSIVSITTKVTTDYTYFFQSGSQETTGAGSGVIIGKTDKVLYVVTNYHVIKGADEINVGFIDSEIVKASVVGYDESQDIAVVAVPFSDMKESTASAITIATIGNSDELKVGEPAIAIGNALGFGQSVTVGYISALNRTVENSDGRYIQTDAAINPGNSGGALISAEGKLIGINSVKYVDSKVEGMGFSIPINTAMEIVNDIISGEHKKGAYLGIEGADISEEYSKIYGFPEGIYVKEVLSDSPAKEAGLYPGDIIVEIGDKSVYTIEELKKKLQNYSGGDTVKLVVYRTEMGRYNKVEIEVTLQDAE